MNPNLLRAILQGEQRSEPARPALDVIPIPKGMVDEFFQRLITMMDAYAGEDRDADVIPGSPGGSVEAGRKFWGWLEQAVPATKKKDVRINLGRATCPTLEITGDYRPPHKARGVLDYVHIEEGSPEDQFICKSAEGLKGQVTRERKAYASYKLWSYLEECFPKTSEGNWRIVPTPTDGIYLLKIDDEEE